MLAVDEFWTFLDMKNTLPKKFVAIKGLTWFAVLDDPL